MFRTVVRIGRAHPRQFWVLVMGMLLVSIGGSLWWPFITIYMREQLDVSLTQVTLLFTLHSAAGLVATTVVGPAVDRFGRRGAMIAGLFLNGVALAVVGLVSGLWLWAAALILLGFSGPIYRIGSDAMVADMIPSERRPEAYAILRMGNNFGVAIGPAIGGFIAAISYSLAYFLAAGANLIFALLVVLFVRETMARGSDGQSALTGGGYGPVLRDRRFIAFCAIMIVATIPSPLLMMLLPAYGKEHFGVLETQYGFIMSTNAIMVVLLQVIVTRWSTRFPNLPIIALGALLYGLGAGSVALGSSFWPFWGSMVILTFGELLLVPTGTAFAANAAPAAMRGRYMGMYGLTWSVAFGIGPVLGGWLNDNIAPVMIWIGGLVAGLAGVAGFLLLWRRVGRHYGEMTPPAAERSRA